MTTLAVSLITFGVGYLLGRWDLHRSREDHITMFTTRLSPERRQRVSALYRRVTSAVILPAFLMSAIGVWIGVGSVVTNTRQDADAAAANKARDDQNTALLECFDDYLGVQQATNKAVRDASVRVADAETSRDQALNDLFVILATDPPEGDPDAIRVFTVLFKANADLVDAQAQLARVRADNPIADPPSVACNLDEQDTP